MAGVLYNPATTLQTNFEGQMMQAGKKMDEWVAQHVLLWRNEEGKWFEPSRGKEVNLRPFSTDIASAWELVDPICDQGRGGAALINPPCGCLYG